MISFAIGFCFLVTPFALGFPQNQLTEPYNQQQQTTQFQQTQPQQSQQTNQHLQYQQQAHLQGNDASTPVPIISQTEIVGPDGSFNFSYETGNGIRIQEGGYLKQSPSVSSRSGGLNSDESENDGYIQVLQGSYSYTAPDGQVISLRYIADENGFQPEGDHLPTAPPIPQDILRSLNEIPNSPDGSQQYPQQQQQQQHQQQYQQQFQQLQSQDQTPQSVTYRNYGDSTQNPNV